MALLPPSHLSGLQWTAKGEWAAGFGHERTDQPGFCSDAPLEPTAIAALQERLRSLAHGHREAFSRAFRSAFQVPEATPSVAGLINQERHRIWIEEFLAKAAGG